MHTTELPMIAWKEATRTGNLLFSKRNFQEAFNGPLGDERMSPLLRQAAQRHSRETCTELRLFAKKFDRNPEVQHALQTGCDMRCLDGVSPLH
jgi:hypothetical protein